MQEVLASLFRDAQNQLMAAKPGELTAVQAHARMLALRDIRSGFEAIVNDAKIATATKRAAV